MYQNKKDAFNWLNTLHVTFTIPRYRLGCWYRPVQNPCIDWCYRSIKWKCIKIKKSRKMSRMFFLSMCDVKIFLTFTSPNMVLLRQLFYLFWSCVWILLQWQLEPLNRNESGRFGALKSDSTHHFFRNAFTNYGFHSFPVVDWFCLFIWLWVLTFPL
jgi:hypothetical protein